MDYEKKYKEVIGKIQGLIDGSKKQGHIIVRVEDLEKFFPELAESEDEKIRKAIYIYLDWLDGRKDYQPKGDYTIKNMIAWLEKQGKIDTKSYEIAEKEKREFVGDGFIKCYADFQDFKEGQQFKFLFLFLKII